MLGLRGAVVYLIVGILAFVKDALFVGFVLPGETPAQAPNPPLRPVARRLSDRAVEILFERGFELERKIDLADQSLRAPDSTSRRVIVDQLAAHRENGQALLRRWAVLASVLG